MITRRPSIDEYFLTMAVVASTRGTCARRRVGCVLVNERNHIMATGYNGPSRGEAHCIDAPCPGASMPSGTGLSTCESIHGEANALLQCRDVYSIKTVYCTTSPCVDCVKLLLNTSAQRIVFLEKYPHTQSEDRWIRNGRVWEHYRPQIDAYVPNLSTQVSALVGRYGVEP